jgi:desampylase
MTNFVITGNVLEQLEALAREGFPHEICGFIGGVAPGTGSLVRPARNVARARKVEYNIAPEETLATLLSFELSGYKITGVYHSHPNYPPQPSGTDLALADMPDACYLITSVEKVGGKLHCETRAWRIHNGYAQQVELTIAD